MKKIFIYGSLKRNEYNYSRFLDDPKTKFLRVGILKGYVLYDLGSYPTAVKEKGSYILGEIFSVSDKVFNRISNMETHAMYSRGRINKVYFFYMDKNRIKNYGVKIGLFWSYKLYGR